MSSFGELEGETCHRDGCQGILKEHKPENCCCHINPPCGACVEPREWCPVCDWQAKDEDEHLNGYILKYKTGVPPVNGYPVVESWKPRPLDPRKIDYRIHAHSNSSQRCEGVYPEGTTQAEVLARVKGTFGGRFVSFANGKFEYIAYTD